VDQAAVPIFIEWTHLSLKESSDLRYAADVVLFLTEAQEHMATPPARAVEQTVAKNRYGDAEKVGLLFRPALETMHQEARP
jgi:replicative DNA helicase